MMYVLSAERLCAVCCCGGPMHARELHASSRTLTNGRRPHAQTAAAELQIWARRNKVRRRGGKGRGSCGCAASARACHLRVCASS
eukprot:scaffold8784_cov105-Isochrysis_galbana.AAC.3